jgi:hypothetical protein
METRVLLAVAVGIAYPLVIVLSCWVGHIACERHVKAERRRRFIERIKV